MPHRILIVEDEMLVAMEMEDILQGLGFDVLGIAPDLNSALACADGEQIDLALVDLNLRDGLTGPEIGERLAREHHATVLFITANPRLLGDGIAGTIGVLTKPTNEVALRKAVEFALRHRRGETVEPPAELHVFALV